MSITSNDTEVDIHEVCKLGDFTLLSELLSSESFYPEICLEEDSEGLLPYHYCLLYSQAPCISLLLSLGLDLQIPFQGLMPIHLALARSGFKSFHASIIETVNTLIKHQQDISARDRLGRTALHIVCANGLFQLIPIVIQSGVKPELKDFSGKMAIHYAIENNEAECLRQILQEGGSDMFFYTDYRGDKPIHIAVRFAAWECLNVLISLGSEEMLMENNELEQTPEDIAKNCGVMDEFLRAKKGEVFESKCFKGTVIITDDFLKLHAALPEALRKPENIYKQRKNQPENPKRLDMIVDPAYGSLLANEFDNLTWIKNIDEVNICEVLRVHEYSYVSNLKACIEKISPTNFLTKFDIDTVVSCESFKAALIAANCVIRAVDEVMNENFKNAFCAVRPPGHHVGPFGAVASEEDPGSQSTGFCLFNNVAIAAAYAKYTYRNKVKKIAIVDFDVHHGNGTEAIIKNLSPSTIAHEFNSIPFIGKIQCQSYKPWLSEDDSKNVLFISSHAYGSDGFGKFYPASGRLSFSENVHPAGILNIPLPRPTDSFLFRSGFDAHGLDEINHGFVDLDEDDFRWVTEELVKIANLCCEGKIVSVLEGGYSIKGEIVSALGLSVASHVRALNRANKEHWTYSWNSVDEAKISLKNKIKEDLKLMKRKRRTQINERDGRELKEFMNMEFENCEEQNSQDEDSEDENSEEDEESEQENSKLTTSENQEDYKSDKEQHKLDLDTELGNRTIE